MVPANATLPAVFDALFAPDVEEAAFYAALLAPADAGVALDVGGGGGRLARILPGHLRPLVVDVSREWLSGAAASGVPAVQGDLRRLPVASSVATAIVSGLLVFNHAGSGEGFRRGLCEARRVSRPGAPLVLEIAAAWNPRALQGQREVAEPCAGGRFEFLYHDILATEPGGMVLATEMRLALDGAKHTVRADLFVPALEAVGPMLTEAGWRLVGHHPPYDSSAACAEPPADCRRTILLALADLPGI